MTLPEEEGEKTLPRVFVPADSGACSVGADEVALRLKGEAGSRGIDVSVVRTGSRAAYWLEPLVEVELPPEGQSSRADRGRSAKQSESQPGRIAYGPILPGEVSRLIDEGFLEGRANYKRLGLPKDIGFLARQERVVFSRCGIVRPTSLEDYERFGGLIGLRRALEMAPEEIIQVVTLSGLRGRGGAGFPTGIKWKTVASAEADRKYVCVNADEGDSGTYADRVLLEGDPFCLFEGMAIAAIAVGATQGFIYLRSEYPAALRTLKAAAEVAREKGLLGQQVMGSRYHFDVEIRVGAGAYICGEETSMLESLEGHRGIVRAKPPLPAVSGLCGKPTVVNNVVTLASVPWIIANGADAYQDMGVGISRGTQPFQLSGNVAHGGLVEVPFGVTLRELVEGFGAGTASGLPVKAVQVGGPLGAYIAAGEMDLEMDYEVLANKGAMLGHGGIVVFDETADMGLQARFAMEFCAAESCGKCTPCRIGSVRGVELIDKIRHGHDVQSNLELLDELCEAMELGSLCAMGSLTPMPVRSIRRQFLSELSMVPASTVGTRELT